MASNIYILFVQRQVPLILALTNIDAHARTALGALSHTLNGDVLSEAQNLSGPHQPWAHPTSLGPTLPALGPPHQPWALAFSLCSLLTSRGP